MPCPVLDTALDEHFAELATKITISEGDLMANGISSSLYSIEPGDIDERIPG